VRRQFTIALVVFEAFLFNVFIPWHTRGMIELPGAKSGHSCCATPKHDSQNRDSSDGKRAANCAICAFAARIVVPPAIDFAPGPSGFVEICPVPVTQQLSGATLLLPYFGRAPPLAA
jgi:hypothetical protein